MHVIVVACLMCTSVLDAGHDDTCRWRLCFRGVTAPALPTPHRMPRSAKATPVCRSSTLGAVSPWTVEVSCRAVLLAVRLFGCTAGSRKSDSGSVGAMMNDHNNLSSSEPVIGHHIHLPPDCMAFPTTLGVQTQDMTFRVRVKQSGAALRTAKRRENS